ncbi:MAG: hypothetical protein MZU79_04550 [Anaerotruncus sp.]|nr:hypothetical protein [Anaerotruncus sp.]
MMRETGLDMWIISCNEDNLDPVFETMIPYENWNPDHPDPRLLRPGAGQGRRAAERLPDRHPGPVQERLGRRGLRRQEGRRASGRPSAGSSASATRSGSASTRARSSGRPAALTSVLKKRIVEAVGPKYAARAAVSAEPLVTLWARNAPRRGGRGHGAGRGPVALDHRRHVLRRGRSRSARRRPRTCAGTTGSASPTSASGCPSARSSRSAAASPKDVEKWGKDDKVIRPGDLPPLRRRDQVHALEQRPPGDGLRPRAPARRTRRRRFKKLMAEANRLQDVYCGEFKTGPDRATSCSAASSGKAQRVGIPGPRVYSPLARAFPPRARARSSACPGSRSTTSAAATSSSSP